MTFLFVDVSSVMHRINEKNGIRYINRGFLNPFPILRSDSGNKENGTQNFS